MGKDYLHKGARPWTPLGPAEQAFLLACLQVDGELPPSPGLDWPLFIRRVRSDGLAALVYDRLKLAAGSVPPEHLDQLKHDYYQNVSANHIRLEELKRIGRSLAPHAIPLLVLKGGALATTVFKDPALRFMGDLDVAAPPDHAEAAVAQLQQDGYRLVDDAGQDVSGGKSVALMRERGWHLRLVRVVQGKPVEVEFHWPLRQHVLVNQAATLDLQQVWRTAVSLDEAANLWQPAPAMMLLHLCLHTGFQHRFADLGLRHYVDLDRAVRHYSQDAAFWPEFTRQARVARAGHTAFFCLQLANRLLHTPLPPATWTPIRPPRWKQRLFDRRFTPADAVNRTRAFYDRHRLWWRLLTVERPADLLAGPWQVLFPGRDYLATYYHSQNPLQLAAYALWHPFHALSRAGRRRMGELAARGNL